ncbi:hypothetical protein WDU94_010198 [Cyamophila willieti]
MLPNLSVHYLTLISLFTLVATEVSTESLQRRTSRDQEKAVGESYSTDDILQRSRNMGQSKAQGKALRESEGMVSNKSSSMEFLGKRHSQTKGKVVESFSFAKSLQKGSSIVPEKVIQRSRSSIAPRKALARLKGKVLAGNFSAVAEISKSVVKFGGEISTMSSVFGDNLKFVETKRKYSGGKLNRKRRALNFPDGTSLQGGFTLQAFVKLTNYSH